MIRILVTGSRMFADEALLQRVLDEAADGHAAVAIVHGKCDPRTQSGGRIPWDFARTHASAQPLVGADWLADLYAGAQGWTREPHAADWLAFPRAAGHIRNRLMVKLGADVCHAFPLGESPGTRGCAALAEKAGIPTTVHEGEADD
jgi:hypothetical protein